MPIIKHIPAIPVNNITTFQRIGVLETKPYIRIERPNRKKVLKTLKKPVYIFIFRNKLIVKSLIYTNNYFYLH